MRSKFSKKTLYILLAVLGVIAVVLILFWTLFALSSVSVEFSSTLANLSVSDEEIVEAGDFSYGSCVLFDGKDKYTENIYSAAAENENLAYVRVVNIETVFPNKYVIHVSEREELYAVQTEDEFLICDRDFRVLRTAQTYQNAAGEPVLVCGLSFSNESVQVGDFLQISQSGMSKFYAAMLSNNRELTEVLGKFEKMELSTYTDSLTGEQFDKLTLTTYSGRIFEICNLDFALSNKISLMFATENALFSSESDADGNLLSSDGKKIYVTISSSGELISANESDEGAVALSFSLISRCKIVVDNLTLDENIQRSESDIYYALVLVS